MNRMHVAMAAVLVVGSASTLGAALQSPHAAPTAPPISSDGWEYLVVGGGTTNLSPATDSSMRKEMSGSFGREHYPLEKNLDKLGARGWELVSVAGAPNDPTYFFKRHR